VEWLVVSVVLSVVLTVLLNVLIRVFPDRSERVARGLTERAERAELPAFDDGRLDHRTARVIVPWKAMIVGSVILTIVVNLVLWFG